MPDVWTTRVVAASVFGIFWFVIGVLCFHTLPPGNHDIIITLVGVLASSCTGVVGFYFGSSKSSQDKDAALSKIATGEGKAP